MTTATTSTLRTTTVVSTATGYVYGVSIEDGAATITWTDVDHVEQTVESGCTDGVLLACDVPVEDQGLLAETVAEMHSPDDDSVQTSGDTTMTTAKTTSTDPLTRTTMTALAELASQILTRHDAYESWPEDRFFPHMRDGHEAEDWDRFRADLVDMMDADQIARVRADVADLRAKFGR